MAILQQDKYFSDAYFLMAMIASAHKNMSKAIQLIEQALKLSPENTEYLAQLAKHYALQSEHVKAKKIVLLALSFKPKNALTFDTLGVTLNKIGLHQQAIPCLLQAISLNKNNPQYHFNLAVSQAFTVNFKEAQLSHENVILLAPYFFQSHLALSNLVKATHEKNNLQRLTALYTQIKTPEDKLSIGHALAKEYEALGDYQQAFKYLQLAKKAKTNSFNHSFNEDQAMFKGLNDFFKSSNIPSDNRGYHSREPLFVVGMPRTGTTLVERILSSHSNVTSVGELEYFALLLKKMGQSNTTRTLDKETVQATVDINFLQLGKNYLDKTRNLSGRTDKFIDKMPFNVLYVGFILKALPDAKIVCLDRNPLDSIVSNYRQLFTANSGSYDYSYDLLTTAQFYIEFKKLTLLWQTLFPDNFYLVNYEKLVSNPKIEAKKLVHFCDLDWQEECLHIENNTAPVATANAVQVRKPISDKSVGNWKKYDAYLDEVKALLTENNIAWS
jgi:tetratricopeptide (TPR) repeat protein